MTALNPLMTIGQQIAEILLLKKGLTGAQCAQAAIDLLAQTGIPEPARRANSFPHQLSGGQRQRAMIAMALASSPKLLLILGLLPYAGHLQVGGQAWQQPAMRNTPANQQLRRRLQVVFQDPFSSLSPRLTVEEIVGEGLKVHEPALTVAQRRARVEAALEEVGLAEAQYPRLLERYPHEFSGGQRQRLAIARALIVQPQVLVLDEPTSALDVTIQQQVLTLLQRLQREKGLSYLLITHDVEVIRAIAHDVVVMKDGAIVESGPVDAVLNRPEHPYTQKLVAAAGAA